MRTPSLVASCQTPVARRAVPPRTLAPSHAPTRRGAALWLVALALLTAAAAAQSPLDAVWSATGFDRVAVQSSGLPKALVTHARDSLRPVTTRHLTRGDDRITLLMRLVARPQALADRRLIPVEGDVLIEALARAGVSVENRALRLGDCVTFDAEGQIAGEGRAMAVARRAAQGPEGTPLQVAGLRLFSRVQALMELRPALRVFPDPHNPKGAWQNLEEADRTGRPETAAARADLHALLAAVAADDAEAARAPAARLAAGLAALPNAASRTRIAVDHAYTTGKPYFWATFAYVVSGVLFFVSLVTEGRRWWWAAVAVMALGLVCNTLGAAARGYLLGRMPLSNLYEATTTGIAFIILFALILEIMHRPRVIGMFASLLSFLYYRWLVSSDAYGNDAIEPLRAVLNSAWLDYHVTTMMLSYGAFTIAFATAALYLLRLRWPRLMAWAPPPEALDLYTHRAIQFGWPLLGVGIVLGAVWADTAWGRMWSWDPKETWSLITWLIYTGYLHVRLVHGWKGAPMAWASILGYAAVLFTYLGVNFILTGLHSYAGGAAPAGAGAGGPLRNPWVVGVAVTAFLAAGTAIVVTMQRRQAAECNRTVGD